MDNMEFSVEQLLGAALSEVENIRVDEEFIVRDLFKGYVWTRIPIGTRIQLGSQFFANIPKNIVATKKTPQHQQVYQRIS